MKRFIEGTDRWQSTLFPECLEDWIGEDNPVRVIDVFVEELDLADLGFGGVDPEATGRPSYHPSALLKLYIYGYLNRVQSSRRLEHEASRNVETMWLTGRLVPDHKTILIGRPPRACPSMGRVAESHGAKASPIASNAAGEIRSVTALTYAQIWTTNAPFYVKGTSVYTWYRLIEFVHRMIGFFNDWAVPIVTDNETTTSS